MDEGEVLHKHIANLMEKISDEVDRLGWEELSEMAVDALCEADKEKDPAKLLVDWYQFYSRLYYRIKFYKEPARFNMVYHDSRTVKHEEVPMYRVQNYDWKMFLWAKNRKLMEFMSNDWFLVPASCLSETEKANFEKKVKSS